jgi:dihydroorotate dehydrogenase
MFEKIRSLIFKFDPETAHDLAIKALKTNIIPVKAKSYECLKVKFLDKEIPNPIGIAAGFDKNAEVYNSLFQLGFGFAEVGTITPKPQFGNPKPRVFRLEEDEALINRLGFNNIGSENVALNIKKSSPKGLLGVNIGPNKDTKNRIDDYLKCFRTFYDLGDYITINISSPNTENLRSFHNPKELEELLNALNEEKKKLASTLKIAVKITPDIKTQDLDVVGNILLSNNVKFVIISNTSDGTRENLKNINKFEKGGISGKPIEEKSNLLINEFYKKFQNKIKIIGVGGIDSGKSAYQKFISGASYIQLYTGMVYQGPNIVNKISDELYEILSSDGVKNIDEIIGSK